MLPDLENGSIVYATDNVSPFDFGTTAAHSCNLGFVLVGAAVRSCGGNGTSVTGEWDLGAPFCQCEFFSIIVHT